MNQKKEIELVRDPHYHNQTSKISNGVESEVIEEIIASIRQIKYGEVVIVVHNSQIVQLEKREKRRFVHREGRDG